MSSYMTNPNEVLQVLSKGDLSVLNALVRMHEGSLEESGLDPQTFMLVRIAALATLDAAPTSWLVNVKVGGEVGVEPEQIVGTLIAIAPVIGSSNLDIRSFQLNLEVTLVCYDAKVVADMRQIEASYLRKSRLVNVSEWETRPAREKLYENISRLTAALQ